MEGTIKLRGMWTATCRGPNGEKTIHGENIVVTNGKEFLASFLYSAAVAAATFTMRYLAVGTDSTAEAVGQTALGTEVARVSGSVSYVSNQMYRVKATFATGVAVGAIVEYGIFSSSTGGTMLNRDTESVINVGSSDVLEVTCDLTIS